MAKTKTSNLKITENQVSADRQQARILFHGDCPKLSSRAAGKLSYEIGIHNTTNTPVIRIAGNESSGAFNHYWIDMRKLGIQKWIFLCPFLPEKKTRLRSI